MQVHGITIGLPVPLPLLARPVRAGFPSATTDTALCDIEGYLWLLA